MRHLQALGGGTMGILRNLRVGVVGSGTGSIVIEQLLRLGVGELVIVDPDSVEHKNLNRILNSTAADVEDKRPKVEIFKRLADSLGEGQKVLPLKANLDSREAVERIAECDILFGCVDTAEGRNLLNRIASFYVLPYVDVGVKLVADGHGGVDTVAGAVHYFAPGGASLLDRGAYTTEQVRAEALKRTDPVRYAELRKSKYIENVDEDRPAVVTVNLFFASLAVNELLARIHQFRNVPNEEFNIVRGDLCEWVVLKEEELPSQGHLIKEIGKGDVEPLIDRPSLSKEQ